MLYQHFVIQQEYLSIIACTSFDLDRDTVLSILHNKNFNKIIFVFPLIYENILTEKKSIYGMLNGI